MDRLLLAIQVCEALLAFVGAAVMLFVMLAYLTENEHGKALPPRHDDDTA